MVLEDIGFDDGVHGAGFLAKAAVDALGEVDVIARRAAGAVSALLGLDGDRQRGADRFAKLARDAALLPVRVTAQRVQPPETRAQRGLFLGILDRDLAPEEMPAGEHHPLDQLDQQERAEELLDAPDHHCHHIHKGVCIHAPRSTIQKMVSGRNTFQPSRMI